VELLFAIIPLARSVEPFAHLLDDPERVFGFVHDLDDERSRIGAWAAWKVVFDPGANFE